MVPTTTARDEKIATVRADVGTTPPPQAPPGHPVGATATVDLDRARPFAPARPVATAVVTAVATTAERAGTRTPGVVSSEGTRRAAEALGPMTAGGGATDRTAVSAVVMAATITEATPAATATPALIVVVRAIGAIPAPEARGPAMLRAEVRCPRRPPRWSRARSRRVPRWRGVRRRPLRRIG